MSGAAGLSAARRRRAGGSSIPSSTSAPPPPPQGQTKSRSNTPHPMQILQDHEMRLRKIEPLLDSLGDSNAPVPQAPDLSGIMARIVALETEAQKKQSDTNNESLSEMFMKLQTFALETNTLVLKMQTRIDELETQLAEKEEDATSMVAVSDVGQELQVVDEDEDEDEDDHENGEGVTESDN